MACETRRGTIASPMTMARRRGWSHRERAGGSSALGDGMRHAARDDRVADDDRARKVGDERGPVARAPFADDDDRVGLDALGCSAAGRPQRDRAVPDAGERGQRADVEPDARQPREKLGAALGRDAHGEGDAGSHQRDPLDPRGDAQLHGADGGPPSESVVHDDEVRRAAQPLGARGQSLGGRRGEAGVADHRQHLFGAARYDDRVALVQIVGGGFHAEAQRHPGRPQPCAVVVEQREPALAMRGAPRPRPARRRRPSRAPRRRPRSPRLWRA